MHYARDRRVFNTWGEAVPRGVQVITSAPKNQGPNLPAPALLKAEEAALYLRLPRTKIYALIGSGELESVKVGRCRRIPRDACDEFVERLRVEQRAA